MERLQIQARELPKVCSMHLRNLPSDEYQTICNKAKKAAEKYDYAKLCVKFKDVCNL